MSEAASRAPRVVRRAGKRELWIGADRQGTYDPRRPGACGRGWYWPLVAKLCAAYLRERAPSATPRAGGTRRADPGGVLLLGLGAATVPRLLARRFPGLPMTAVEKDRRVIALCRAHFAPPASLRVVRADAARFARARGGRHAIVVEDVFAAATQLRFDPARGLDGDYFRALWRNRVAPGGLLLVNVFADGEFAPGRRALRSVLLEFGRLRVFTPEHGANEVWAVLKRTAVARGAGG